MCNLMTTETDREKLIELLDKEEHLAGQFLSGYSGQFYRQKNFIWHWLTALQNSKAEITHNLTNLTFGFCRLLAGTALWAVRVKT
jgi:hypothetical protein